MSDTKVRRWVKLVALNACLAASLTFLLTKDQTSHAEHDSDHQKTADSSENCYQSRTDYQSVTFGRRLRQAFSALSSDTIQTPISNSECDAECQASKKDLEAQMDMALWAQGMFWTNCLIIMVTTLGVFYVARTLGATKIAANATLQGANAAIYANKISKEMMIADTRPWLAQKEVTPVSGLKWCHRAIDVTVKIKMKNTGKTIANNIDIRCMVHIEGEYRVTDLYEALAASDRDLTNGLRVALFPDEDISLESNASCDIRLIRDYVDPLRRGAPSGFDVDNAKIALPRLYLIGCITYDFANQEKIGQTGFIAKIKRQTVEEGGLAICVGEDIRLDKLVIDVMPEYRNLAT